MLGVTIINRVVPSVGGRETYMTDQDDQPHVEPSMPSGIRSTTRLRSSWSDYAHPSTAIVEAVAEAADCEPTALPSLYRAVDSDALDAVLTGGSGPGAVQVTFRYTRYTVAVSSDGAITVAEDADRR
jgi:hypothetical protein